MEANDIFKLIIKADEKLKYADEMHAEQRRAQAKTLLEEALREADAIGNLALSEQAILRLEDLD